jgi:hypothetical protein
MTQDIMGIGAYYNDNTEYGIQIFADKMSNESLCDLLYESTEAVWRSVNNDLRSGKVQRKNCIDDALENLVNLIPVYNMNMYGSYQRKMNVPITKVVDEEFAKIIVTIASSIKVLTELDAIPNDEYNGMLYFEEL